MQNNKLPTKSHVELEDNSIMYTFNRLPIDRNENRYKWRHLTRPLNFSFTTLVPTHRISATACFGWTFVICIHMP